MANKIQIVLHSLPREIDEVKRIVDQLARSQFYIGDTNNVILDFTLNVSDDLTDWENSKIPKQYFIDKFTYIESFSPFVNRFDVSTTCLGCNDKRRNAINSDTDATHILYLDTDVYFSDYNLTMMFDAISQINNKYHIISSEILQLWDPSWDVISNERTRNTDRSKKLWHTNPYRVFDRTEPCMPKLRQIPTVKFGGGWFNIFSKNLLKFDFGSRLENSSILVKSSATFSKRSFESGSVEFLKKESIPKSSTKLLDSSVALNLFLKSWYFLMIS